MGATGLNSLLELGLSGLRAARAGIGTAGRNVANANTPGYVRQSVDLRSISGDPTNGGVRVAGIIRADDAILAARERTADGLRGQAQTMQASLQALETSLTGGQTSIVEAIAELFGGITELSARPTDPTLRTQVIDRAGGLATRFAQAAAEASRARRDTNEELVSLVDEVSRLAAAVAEQNRVVLGSEQADPAIVDARAVNARRLAELTGGQAIIGGDDQLRFTLPTGQALVDGRVAARFFTQPNAAGDPELWVQTGASQLPVTGPNAGGQLGGQLGGLVGFRDGPLADMRAGLDQLAFDLATSLNTVHQTYAGADGNAGRDFFTAPAAVEGAASALTVNSELVGNPALLGARAPGNAEGDNAGLVALAALRDARLAAGGTRTFVDQGIDLLGNVGAATARASAELDLRRAATDALAERRDGVSGVSTEDELIKLGELQRAHQMSTRFLSVVDELYQDLLNRI
jgi:flagellar hook-associated protein 1 FlgK